MTNLLKYLIIALAVLCLFLSAASAQTYTLTPTTLSTAITDSQTQVMTVASATTVSGYTVVAGTVGYIDTEVVIVKPLNGAVSGATLAIVRAQNGTAATPHASGATVFLGPPAAFFSVPDFSPGGSCTRTKLIAVPYINTRNGVISDCLGGQWVQGLRTATPKKWIPFPDPGATAYTSINTNGTTLGSTTLYCTEVQLPYSKLLTGIALLNGTTAAGTDKHYVVLYDSAGNLLANSAVAGAATSGASAYQAFAFTSAFFATGPAQYFACFQTNGTTDTVRMALTGIQDTVLTKGQTSATFGTIPALTVPTTFTTAVGPYVYLY